MILLCFYIIIYIKLYHLTKDDRVVLAHIPAKDEEIRGGRKGHVIRASVCARVLARGSRQCETKYYME